MALAAAIMLFDLIIVGLLIWIVWDFITHRKIIGTVIRVFSKRADRGIDNLDKRLRKFEDE